MNHHKHLTAERVRQMPWTSQAGMVASELSRAGNLAKAQGTEEARRCLLRARELMGILETNPAIPPDQGIILAENARSMTMARLMADAGLVDRLCRNLTEIYAKSRE